MKRNRHFSYNGLTLREYLVGKFVMSAKYFDSKAIRLINKHRNPDGTINWYNINASMLALHCERKIPQHERHYTHYRTKCEMLDGSISGDVMGIDDYIFCSTFT